jgi:hypothetical protein
MHRSSATTLALALLVLGLSQAGCKTSPETPDRAGPIRAAKLETSLTLREHKLPGAGKPDEAPAPAPAPDPGGKPAPESKLAPAFEDPRIAKSYGFTPPAGTEPAPADPAAKPPPEVAAKPPAAGKPPKQAIGITRMVQQMHATRDLANRADKKFLELVAGKLPFAVNKDEKGADAIIELEIKEDRIDPPKPGTPGVVALTISLRMRAVGNEDETAFEREERIERPSPELGEDPGVLAGDTTPVFAALGAAVEDGAAAAAGWLIEANERGDPPAAPQP